MKFLWIILSVSFMVACTSSQQKDRRMETKIVDKERTFRLEHQISGPTLGYSPKSGVEILAIEGYKFKDLNKNGRLDIFEDWRLSSEERAKDLAGKMSTEDIAGLMLYCAHQPMPGPKTVNGIYGVNSASQNPEFSSELTNEQRKILSEDNIRHILVTNMENPLVAVEWNNKMQAYVEAIGWGIPGNISYDQQQTATTDTKSNAEIRKTISLWPNGLALAATFDPSIANKFGEIISREYRALGITTALSPQIDLGTEPRWHRISMTFGESPELTTDMARAYIEGLQNSVDSVEIADGWGYHSVNAIVKHWPGGGTSEGGRGAHWAFGKYSVYPGKNFQMHLKPFTEGAFKLENKTKMASAVMPYYTICYNQAPDKSNRASSFSKWIITDLLRDKYGYDGVVCSDWMITHEEGNTPDDSQGKSWGVENLSIDERYYVALMAGVDQFGGSTDRVPILTAYQLGTEKHGEAFMRNRFEQSAIRLLRNIFRLGLFENPYLDPAESEQIVGNAKFSEAGYNAQLKSVVMLKNKDKLMPLHKQKTVFIPKRSTPEIKDLRGNISKSIYGYPVNMNMVSTYYTTTEDPDAADYAIVFVRNPHFHADGGGYDKRDRESGGNGYVPISLQYSQYTAIQARAKSIAAGDPVIDPEITNRSYQNKSCIAVNKDDLDLILSTRKQMKDKPVIVVINADRPMVFCEFEHEVEGILIHFGVSEQAILDIISGKAEPSGLLPIQMPSQMNVVEKQKEDVPFDMECHKDTEGNIYDFGYGLNWSGIIQDERTEKYVKHK